MKKVYLAGPDVFYYDAEARFARLKRACEACGFKGVAPTDGLTNYNRWTDILAHCICAIDKCNIVLANLTPFRGANADDGTAFEVGYATAKGKRVVSYSYDTRELKHKVELFDRVSSFVEDFGLSTNLMLFANGDVYSSPEEALKILCL